MDKWDDAQRAQINALIAAVRGGKSVAEFLEVATGSDDVVVEALLLWRTGGEPFFNLSRELLQCARCGRLLVETKNGTFRSFLPESDDALGILND